MPSLAPLARCLPALSAALFAKPSSVSGFFIPLAFSLFVVALLGAKCFLLARYEPFVGVSDFILFLPTFFTQDVVAICIARVLLSRRTSRLVCFLQATLGSLFAIIFWGAAASEIGFYVNTGSEVEWKATQTLLADPAAMKVLGSGRRPVTIAAVLMFLLALLLQKILYNAVGDLLSAIWMSFLRVALRVTRKIRIALGRQNDQVEEWQLTNKEMSHRADEESGPSYSPLSHESDDEDSHESSATLLPSSEPNRPPPPSKYSRVWKICRIVAICWFFFLYVIRPSKPFNHMSATLPVKMLDIFSTEGDLCDQQSDLVKNEFPFPELISQEHWLKPNGKFKGWAPGVKYRAGTDYAIRRPDWLPDPLPPGFERFNAGNNQSASAALLAEKDCHFEDKMYDPVIDPLRITNIQEEVLPELKKVFDDKSVTITHILLVMMESIRWDVFPVRNGSHLHSMVLEPNKEEDYEEVNQKLALVSPNAELFTGISGGWNRNGTLKNGNFTPAEPGMGGITVASSVSPSTYSAKSILGATCGCSALVKDFFEEHKHYLYQPCFPHIFNLFNENKKGKRQSEAPRVQDRQWETVWMQASTDDWDHQDKFTKQMGFHKTFYKKNLKDPNSKYYPPTEKEINYFGFADQELKPYLRDYMLDAVQNNKRLFLGHITATSHHPWDTPKSFSRTRYVPDGLMERFKVLNSYLNAVAYDDIWMGTIFELLEETGIANETLTIMIGDHGLGFPADTEIRGTFGNSHISTFRVPLVIHHPHLPRVHLSANASSLSVLPTVLDLLVNTGSLDEHDADIAGDLINNYEGQSLIRPYKSRDGDRQAWNIGVLNPGGQMLSLVSAAVPWRLVIPVEKEVQYRFSNLETDPEEISPLEDWSLDGLINLVEKQEGKEAAEWTREAEAIAQWWLKENRALWDLTGPQPSSPNEHHPRGWDWHHYPPPPPPHHPHGPPPSRGERLPPPPPPPPPPPSRPHPHPRRRWNLFDLFF
ncbi:hypothetical protein VTO42DRAFT_3158 [Malbranchea cinnamomea]